MASMPISPPLHPWHDIPPGPNPPDVFTAVIEIPKFSRNKYELDKELGLYRLDRVLHSAVHFPGDYGFIPQTLAGDDDPLDVLVLMTLPVFTGCLVDVRPIGLFHLVDRGVPDEKVLAIPLADGRTIALVHARGRVFSTRATETSLLLDAEVPESLARRLTEFHAAQNGTRPPESA